jgi:hypothetical protein
MKPTLMASANAPAKSCSLTPQDDRSEVKLSTGRSSMSDFNPISDIDQLLLMSVVGQFRTSRRTVTGGLASCRATDLSWGLRLGLLTVARQYLLAGTANLGPVRLQTPENA